MRKLHGPSPQEPIVTGWGQEGVQIWSLGLLPVAARGWLTACFTGQLYGIHYAHLTASVILSDGSAKRNDELLSLNVGWMRLWPFCFGHERWCSSLAEIFSLWSGLVTVLFCFLPARRLWNRAPFQDAGRHQCTLTQHVLSFNESSHKFVRIIRDLSFSGFSKDKNSWLKASFTSDWCSSARCKLEAQLCRRVNNNAHQTFAVSVNSEFQIQRSAESRSSAVISLLDGVFISLHLCGFIAQLLGPFFHVKHGSCERCSHNKLPQHLPSTC